MSFTLPDLPYAHDALAPIVSAGPPAAEPRGAVVGALTAAGAAVAAAAWRGGRRAKDRLVVA